MKALLAFALAAGVVVGPLFTSRLPALDGAVVQFVDGIDDPTPATWNVPSVAVDRCLTVWTVHAAADSATPTDDQDNVWSTPQNQDGSGYRILQSIKCDTSAATYNVSLDIALRTFILKYIVEWSGLQTASCIDDEAATGNQDTVDTTPLTGVTVTCSGACVIAGLGVSTANLTSNDTEISERTSTTTILGNLAWKRLTAAGDGNLSWAMSVGAPTLSLSVALKEIAGGAARTPCPIVGGGYVGCTPLIGWTRPVVLGARPVRAWVVYPNGSIKRVRLS